MRPQWSGLQGYAEKGLIRISGLSALSHRPPGTFAARPDHSARPSKHRRAACTRRPSLIIMIKDRQPDWQDTNMSLFGSDIEKKCKAAAASGEPQWRGAGKIPGLQVWRIEQFRVKSWPKVKYGRFHEGDSYIILHTYQEDPANNPEKLAWDAYFWIGGKSTQDEYGTAAYKTVELDHYLNDAAVQYREVQESESSRFRALFNDKIMVLSGGVASGFKHVEAEVRESRLFTVKGRADNLVLKQVELRRDSMNSGGAVAARSNHGPSRAAALPLWIWHEAHPRSWRDAPAPAAAQTSSSSTLSRASSSGTARSRTRTRRPRRRASARRCAPSVAGRLAASPHLAPGHGPSP